MEHEGSLPHTQVLATCPDRSSPCHNPISWRSILIVSSHLRMCLPSGLFPSDPQTKTLYAPRLGRRYRTKMKKGKNVIKRKKQFLSFNLSSLHTKAGYSRYNFKWQFRCITKVSSYRAVWSEHNAHHCQRFLLFHALSFILNQLYNLT